MGACTAADGSPEKAAFDQCCPVEQLCAGATSASDAAPTSYAGSASAGATGDSCLQTALNETRATCLMG